MNKFLITSLLFIVCSTTILAQKINYVLKMSNPQSHYFEVEMILEGFKQKEIEIKIPVSLQDIVSL